MVNCLVDGSIATVEDVSFVVFESGFVFSENGCKQYMLLSFNSYLDCE